MDNGALEKLGKANDKIAYSELSIPYSLRDYLSDWLSQSLVVLKGEAADEEQGNIDQQNSLAHTVDETTERLHLLLVNQLLKVLLEVYRLPAVFYIRFFTKAFSLS